MQQFLSMTREKRSLGAGSGRGAYMKWLAENNPEQMKEIASQGGQKSHANRTAHEWTAEDGRAANSLRKVRGFPGSRRSQ